MKKFLLPLVAVAVCMTANAQEYYSTDFSTESEFQKWTPIDANNDGTTWKFDEGGSQSKVFYPYSATNQADDWLISPEITATGAQRVMVSYTTYGTSYGEAMSVYTGNAPTVEGMTQLQASYDHLFGERQTNYFLFDTSNGQPFRVGFHCTSPADTWRFYLCNFSVKKVEKAVDLCVDSIISPKTGKNLSQETVKVRIANNGLEAADNFSVAYTVDGGTPVVEHVTGQLQPNATMEYTFAQKVDLSQPRHNYKIQAYTIDSNDIVTANDTLAVTVRHQAPVNPPYTMGFEKNEDTADFQYFNLNHDDGDWEVYTSVWMNMARTGYSCLAYNYNKDNQADDWAILDGINVEAGDYVLRYWYSGSDGHTEKLRVCYGNDNTPEAMTHQVDEQSDIKQGAYQESFKIIHFDEPQTIYLGFYAYSDANENWLTIDDVQFYKAASNAVDLVTSRIETPFDYVRTPNNKDVTFEVKNVGILNADATLTVSVDSVVKKQTAISLQAQEIKSLQAKDVLTDLSEGRHTLTVSIDCATDNDSTNNSLTKDFVVLGNPVMLYDFEDARIPDSLSFYVGDEGTVNPNAGDEFNEQGWGIMNLEAHVMYGQHLLAATSWLDGTTKADRWVILPRFTVTGPNAYFAWDASSGNNLYLEDYCVKVSDGSGKPQDWWYTTEKEVKGETIYPKTRGIDLGKYEGKNIYIAINLVTKNGDFLALDNLGVYGDMAVTSAINTLKTDTDQNVIVTGKTVSCTGATAITVSDISGRTALQVNGSKADISSLAAGVYVANVKTANGNHTVKFVKK